MNLKKIKIRPIDRLIIILAVLALISLFYPAIDNFLGDAFSARQEITVTRIVDGDTIDSSIGKIRFLGINTPEKGEKYYAEAKEFTESQIGNKTVMIEFGEDRKDMYNRTLAYIFCNGENINQKLVESGLANAYFPEGKQKYYSNFQISWKDCIGRNINLCEASKDECAACIELREFRGQTITLHNKCSFSCSLKNWSIKDEGRKKFIFNDFALNGNSDISITVGDGNDSGNVMHWRGEEYVWTSTGDTMFLRDDEGRLVLWHIYSKV
jgi:endonuclease YncB( thermonuclease family)